ncbi:hypothetical protein GCM10010182_74720 [Actinomadura cremea]|nr:hypothetical protein GCM10010182_74720 [Actinomadura cremea]
MLPRSHKVVGRLPLLHDEPSNSYAFGWRLGDRLARQRRWDSAVREDLPAPWKPACTGAEIDRMHDEGAGARPDIRGRARRKAGTTILFVPNVPNRSF